MVSVFSSDSDSDMEVLAQLSDWDSTSTDSDSKEEQLRGSLQRIKRLNYMQTLEDAEFTFRFRLSKNAVASLMTEIMPYVRVTSSRNHGVPPLHQLLLTLRFYALGTMLISVADFVGVSKSTAGRIVRDISSAIASLYDKYVFVNLGGAKRFYEIAGFPQVLGAIDCTHIRIQSLCHIIGEEFRNCEGYFSLNVQAVCDADFKFINVVARWPGSTQNATIFNNSVLRAQFDAVQFDNHWLLGDSAYPNRRYLLTPLINPRTEAEHRYNEAHFRTRNTINRTFAIWKRRFPVLAVTLRLSLPVVQATVIATSVLHNICKNNDIKEVPPEIELPFSTDDHDDTVQNVNDQDLQTRDNVIQKYFTLDKK